MSSLFAPGVYPAAVTPMDSKQGVDEASLAKLLAWFEAAGCQGVVLAGTNGEGPSLSATEKRELIACAAGMRGKLELILGIATPSIEEAVWLGAPRGRCECGSPFSSCPQDTFEKPRKRGSRIGLNRFWIVRPCRDRLQLPHRTGITLSSLRCSNDWASTPTWPASKTPAASALSCRLSKRT